jgi:hypothetical protein
MPVMAGIILNSICGNNRDGFNDLARAWKVFSACLKAEISNIQQGFLKTVMLAMY